MMSDHIAKQVCLMEGKNILITGGTGFIGQNLISVLESVSNVFILSHSRCHDGKNIIYGDITNIASLRKNCRNLDFDIVFHMAGSTITPQTINQGSFFDVNATGTKNILDLCREFDIEKLIYSSTMSVFGQPNHVPVDEKHPKIPVTHYGMSKLIGELYCSEFFRTYGVKSIYCVIHMSMGPANLLSEHYQFLLNGFWMRNLSQSLVKGIKLMIMFL